MISGFFRTRKAFPPFPRGNAFFRLARERADALDSYAMKHYVSEPFRVRFSETDMAGVVHFSQMLRWAENAESEFFREHGQPFVEKGETAGTLFGWPRARVAADFLAPAHYDERIRVRIRPRGVPAENSSALHWDFEIVAGEESEPERAIARGSWTSVYARVDSAEKSVRAENVPEAVRKILKIFEN